MANLLRDQEAAELGDHKRGLSSDDLPNIQKVRLDGLPNPLAYRTRHLVTDHACPPLAFLARVPRPLATPADGSPFT